MRKGYSKRIQSDQELDCSFEAKQTLMEHSTDCSSRISEWGLGLNKILNQTISLPKTQPKVTWLNISQKINKRRHTLKTMEYFREKTAINSFMFPLGNDDEDGTCFPQVNSVHNPQTKKILSHLTIKKRNKLTLPSTPIAKHPLALARKNRLIIPTEGKIKAKNTKVISIPKKLAMLRELIINNKSFE